MHGMVLTAQITEIETRLGGAGVPLGRLFDRSGVDRSTWSRWRSGKVSPTLRKFAAVMQALDELAPANAQNSPASDSTASRDASASLRPKPETARSLSGVRSRGGGGA
jgi:transcriptional regulator with XRE-family HTH domain